VKPNIGRKIRGFIAEHFRPPREGTLRYPDFFVIGAQKAGTTWLMNQLTYHPQIWCPIVKELFYFDEFYGRGDVSWAAAALANQLASP
jgi:hypothetical protein